MAKNNSKIKKNNSKDNIGNEIVFGLISPMGIDTASFQNHLENILREYNYSLEPIKLSKYLESSIKSKNIKVPTNEYDRKIALINEGDALRKANGNHYLAKIAISSICAVRMDLDKNNQKSSVGGRKVFLINGLKHFKEIDFLRSLYGTSFFLIGLFASEEQRIAFLEKDLTKEKAKELIQKDQDNLNKHGQQLSKSFYRADVFIPFSNDIVMDKELRRFIDLVFGYPYHTPRIDEHMMFHAYSASLRSADLSRQVGAVIATSHGDIISSGANDVPKFGGGQYWADDSETGNDNRDYVKKYDSNKQQRTKIIEDILSQVNSSDFSQLIKRGKDKNFIDSLKKVISDSEIKSITEYGRAVHAEMAALTTAARLGMKSNGCTLYTTTFPCHNCAKHVIASGIKKVVYVEPYPKSLAFTLHGDAACQGPLENRENKLVFEPFMGIGPRRFFDLFSLTLSNGEEIERNEDGKIRDFHKIKSTVFPRIRMNMESIIEQEKNCFLETFKSKQGGANGKAKGKRAKKLRKPNKANSRRTSKSRKRAR